MTSANVDYEQAGELKIGQVGIANLRIRTLDVDQLVREMRERVDRAPKLFGRAAVILDFGGLARMPDVVTAQSLIDGLRAAGVLPVALAYGSRDTEVLAEQLGLPLLAKFRAQYESSAPAAPAPAARLHPQRARCRQDVWTGEKQFLQKRMAPQSSDILLPAVRHKVFTLQHMLHTAGRPRNCTQCSLTWFCLTAAAR